MTESDDEEGVGSGRFCVNLRRFPPALLLSATPRAESPQSTMERLRFHPKCTRETKESASESDDDRATPAQSAANCASPGHLVLRPRSQSCRLSHCLHLRRC